MGDVLSVDEFACGLAASGKEEGGIMTNMEGGLVRWGVAQIWSKRTQRIRDEIEKLELSTLIPTFGRVWYTGGKESALERPLMPGYLLFQLNGESWSPVAKIDGVIRILNCDGKASVIRDDEAYRLTVDDAMHAHNIIEAPPAARGESKPTSPRRRRRPRRSKRARSRPGPMVRAKMRAERECA